MDAHALQQRLAELCGDAVPGASVALTDGTDVVTAVHGVTSLRTGVPVTPETLFQIGSITKVYTATLVMTLVDQGKVDLDAPVQTYLPWFAVADAEASSAITIRHLLCHTAGFEGDDFTDTGRGDDAVRLYVERLAKAAQIHPVGAMFSYANSGFSVLGLVVEAVTGLSWDAAVQFVLGLPLGVTLATLPEQAILHPHALGHVELPTSAEPDAPRTLQVAPIWSPPRSVGPAGTICTSATDLLAFGRMHVDGGAPVLSAASVAAMQQEQVRLLDSVTHGLAWGLGWILPAPGVIAHDGATFGQYAFYRLHPETGTAMALLTNGPGARVVAQGLIEEFFTPLCGVELPGAPEVPAQPPAIDVERFVGVYERQELRIEVQPASDGTPNALDVTVTPLGPTAGLAGPTPPYRCVGHGENRVITVEPFAQTGARVTATFVVPEGAERAQWVHLASRATPRVS